jgi:hypothetical protein
LEEVELDLDPARNYFYGANGAGKTSLLEAVYLLGRGRSFRTRQARTLVRHGQAGLSVYGDVDDGVRLRRLGAAFADRRLERRVDGAPASGAAVAGIVAVQAIGPDSHRLIEGGRANVAGSSIGECSTWNILTSRPGSVTGVFWDSGTPPCSGQASRPRNCVFGRRL